MGEQRELKFALEKYWSGKISLEELHQVGQLLRDRHWKYQSRLDFIPVGDFSYYDHVLDTSFLLGHLPERAKHYHGNEVDNYFRVARGRTQKSDGDSCCHAEIEAGEMTKWFDTNYHYIVPELTSESSFSLNADRLIAQINEALETYPKAKIKPVIIGPITWLWLGKASRDFDRLSLLSEILPIYQALFEKLDDLGIEWVQIDEPCLATELDGNWQHAFNICYHQLSKRKVKLLLTTYFGTLQNNLYLAAKLPIDGLHIDAINAKEEIVQVLNLLPQSKVLSIGVIQGRNIWKTDLKATLAWLQPLCQSRSANIWVAPSCSLLHVPVDLDLEEKLDAKVKPWLSFAKQKLNELHLLAQALNNGVASVQAELQENSSCIYARKTSSRVHQPKVQERMAKISIAMGQRKSKFPIRAALQNEWLDLPLLPTTTIGSFPQTSEIRSQRLLYKKGCISHIQYQTAIKKEIRHAIKVQEELGLDVLVHGEAERNDMVEYFGEQQEGYIFSQNGWVQSYGSRCVKPPILFGDIQRPQAMTVDWIKFGQSLTHKPVKGMLTGPVTMLNWSFVRDDQARSLTCKQLALAIRDEVLDLEANGINVIQIDEAALREGLPLRKNEWQNYLDWAVESFRLTANGVKDKTQIHTHMCYSEFNDIIDAIANMDADVITIETSRSHMELLSVFERFNYPNQIGPGVYDIHSPNIPSVEHIVNLIRKASEHIDVRQLWINPDCGLKTRQWAEVTPALTNMMHAAVILREQLSPEKKNRVDASKSPETVP